MLLMRLMKKEFDFQKQEPEVICSKVYESRLGGGDPKGRFSAVLLLRQ